MWETATRSEPGLYQLVVPRPMPGAPRPQRSSGTGTREDAGRGDHSPAKGRKTPGRGEQSSWEPQSLDAEYLQDSWKRFKRCFNLSRQGVPAKNKRSALSLSIYIYFSWQKLILNLWMFLIFRQKNLTLKRYSRSVMKREDWYFKKQKGQSNVKSRRSCDWSKSKSHPPAPVPRFPLNLRYWWSCAHALRQTFPINPCRAVKVRKGSTKARVKHRESERPYGGVEGFGNTQRNKKRCSTESERPKENST